MIIRPANIDPSQVLTYEQAGADQEFLIEINLSSKAAHGTVTVPKGLPWKEVRIEGVTNTGTRAAPAQVSLQPKEFVVFERYSPSR